MCCAGFVRHPELIAPFSNLNFRLVIHCGLLHGNIASYHFIERRYRLICSNCTALLTSIAACSRDCINLCLCGCHGVGGLRLLYLSVLGNVGLRWQRALHNPADLWRQFAPWRSVGGRLPDWLRAAFAVAAIAVAAGFHVGDWAEAALLRASFPLLSRTALSIVPSSCRPALNPPTPNFSIQRQHAQLRRHLRGAWCTSPEMQKWRAENSERPVSRPLRL